MTDLTGELAALATAISFAITSTFFTFAGREIGSLVVNRYRLLMAIVLIMLLHWLTFGQLFPFDAGLEPVAWLALSGIIGLALGDASLFQSFVLIGPRIAMLIMSLHPVIGTILAWLFLGETLSHLELAGMALTISGIAWVISERTSTRVTARPQDINDKRTYLLGLLFAFGGAMGQAVGVVTSKVGLADDFSPLSANVIRLLAAMVALWAFTAIQGRGRVVESGLRTLRENPRALRFLMMGTVTGPVLGVWLSLVAVQRTPVGVASTLMALTPIFLLPIGAVVFKERISARAIIGTVLAFAGTVLLFV